MRTRSAIILLAFLVVGFLRDMSWADKNKGQARLGGLLVTAQSIDASAPQVAKTSKPGYHDVRFRVMFRNVSKEAICASFTVRLESTLNVESRGSVHFDNDDHSLGPQVDIYPSIHMMLPGEEIGADVVFSGEKDGVEPRTLVIRPLGSSNQGCGSEHPTHYYEPARIPVKNISSVTPPTPKP